MNNLYKIINKLRGKIAPEAKETDEPINEEDKLVAQLSTEQDIRMTKIMEEYNVSRREIYDASKVLSNYYNAFMVDYNNTMHKIKMTEEQLDSGINPFSHVGKSKEQVKHELEQVKKKTQKERVELENASNVADILKKVIT